MSNVDYSLFVKKGMIGTVIILIHVDDIVITGDDLAEILRFKNILHIQFSIQDLGILKYFLELEIAYSKKDIFLNQMTYMLDLLQNTNKYRCQASSNSYRVI